jgi:hypothetical protein
MKLITLLLLAIPLHAEEPFQCYFEFKRELSPDRPDTTESPYTVEKGRFQVEFGTFTFAKDRADGVKTETLTFGETNFKYGLNDSQDLQVIVDPYIDQQSGDGEKSEGFGDIELRLKWNLWGNDGGKTAGAIIPHVTVPTQTAVSENQWEGGIIFPMAVTLSEKFDLGYEVELAREWDEDHDEYDWKLLHSVTLGYAITDHLGAFVEYVGITGNGAYQAVADVGATYNLTSNLQIDLLVAAGISRAADDFTVSQGITFRF